MESQGRALLEPKRYGKAKTPLSDLSEPVSPTKSLPSPSTERRCINGLSKSPISLPTYDPRSLLNPKGGRNQKNTPSRTRRSPQPSPNMSHESSAGGAFLQSNGSGPKSMIENLYGVEQRSERPVKRLKTDSDDNDENKSKSKSSAARGNSGIIGEYMRPKEEDLKPTLVQDLVDLTNDDASDDDVKIVKTVNVADEQEVCFGMIHSTIQAHAIPKPSDQVKYTLSNQWPLIKCSFVRKKSENNIIEVKDPHDFMFGRLVIDCASVLAPVMDGLEKIRAQARITNRPKRPNEWPHQPCSGQMKVIFNLYGRRGDAEKVGRFFGQHNLWLKQPYGVDNGIPIVNPHDHQKPMLPQNTISRASHHYLSDTRTVEEATEAVSRLFDHFANTAKPLAESDPPAVIISPLLPHQKQALTFMLTKESPRTYGSQEEDNSSLWRKKTRGNGAITFEEVVSGVHIKEEPEEVYGGLLADVMGLGKTLEALSLIATTMGEAYQFSKRSVEKEASLMIQSRATLIVTPVSTVKNWEDQIAEHVKPGAIKYCVYHGAGREKLYQRLADHDIVISTYGTIAAECSNKKTVISPIQQIRWFRIVLDEAHTIREPKAAQSQAIYSLYAERRWALTGTPIQNRIDDLGSLTRFLRLYPYDTTVRFTQYIKAPAQSKDPNSIKALRIFVDSFTLRRLKDRIDLPPRKDLVEKLDFTADEQRLHDFFKSISRSQVQEIENNRVPKGKSSGMQHSQVLRGIMTLRLISAHGRELLKEADLEQLKGQMPSEAIDVDDEKTPTISERAAYETLGMLADAGLDLCKNCDKQLSDNTPGAEDNSTRAYVLPCFDVLCSDCFGAHKREFDMMHNLQRLSCPYCSLPVTAQYVAINKSIDDLPEILPESNEDFKRGDYGGLHTKTRALIRDLFEMQQDSLVHEANGEPPIKCVIFSEFTSHLNLIERALTDHNWTFVRIDGTMSLSKRKRVLDELNSNNNVRILLASIKAAGQGLNLTAASRAFIMEPLWNPAAEAQAVDRIYRIGQKRDVMVKRYQMNDSIELKIVKLQVKKQKLADLSMNKNHASLSKKETREEHLKDLLDLFK